MAGGTHRSPEMGACEAVKREARLEHGEHILKKYCRPAGDLSQLINVEAMLQVGEEKAMGTSR